MDETSIPKKLKYLAIQKIISNHSFFNEINNTNFNLPKSLFQVIIDVGPSLIELPKYNAFSSEFHDTTAKFHKSLLYDKTYSKHFVIWVQNMPTLLMENYLPIVVHFVEIHFTIEFDNTEKSFNLCSKCLKLHLNVHPINDQFKIFQLISHKTYHSFAIQTELEQKIRSKKNWCNSCFQVPLFQIANYRTCESIVGETAHNCPKHFPIDENSFDFIYCLNCYGTGIMTTFSMKRNVTNIFV